MRGEQVADVPGLQINGARATRARYPNRECLGEWVGGWVDEYVNEGMSERASERDALQTKLALVGSSNAKIGATGNKSCALHLLALIVGCPSCLPPLQFLVGSNRRAATVA